MFSAVRKRTAKEVLSVLDVGGNMGLALHQAKGVDPKLETTNMTIVAMPVTYPVDHLDVRPAEIFPAEYQNKFDIIISNFAFTYFLYPDIALENCIKALSIGGEARLAVSARDNPLYALPSDSNPFIVDHNKNRALVQARLQKMRGMLMRYIQQGCIELLEGELPDPEKDPYEFHTYYILQKKKEI